MANLLCFLAGAGIATWLSKRQPRWRNSFHSDASDAQSDQQFEYQPVRSADQNQTSNREREEDEARMINERGKKAGDVVVKAAEAVLDFLLMAAHALKEKLADRRASTMRVPPPQDTKSTSRLHEDF